MYCYLNAHNDKLGPPYYILGSYYLLELYVLDLARCNSKYSIEVKSSVCDYPPKTYTLEFAYMADAECLGICNESTWISDLFFRSTLHITPLNWLPLYPPIM